MPKDLPLLDSRFDPLWRRFLVLSNLKRIGVEEAIDTGVKLAEIRRHILRADQEMREVEEDLQIFERRNEGNAG